MAEKETVITIKKESLWKYSTFILAALLIIVLFVWLGGKDGGTGNGATKQATGNTPQQLPPQTGKAEIPITDADVQKGPKDAKVTIVEFSDFSCPFCGGASGESKDVVSYLKSGNPAWEAPVPGVMRDYVKTGKARFVLKYFPGHGSGQQAHLVGWCLYEQNKDAFWSYHDKVFQQQDKANERDTMIALAVSSGGDKSKLESCLSSKKYDARLNDETGQGKAVSVRGTPAFFVNGVEVPGGAIPYEAMKRAIEAAL